MTYNLQNICQDDKQSFLSLPRQTRDNLHSLEHDFAVGQRIKQDDEQMKYYKI